MGNDQSNPYKCQEAQSDSSSAFVLDEQTFSKSLRCLKNDGCEAIWTARGVNSIAPVQRSGHATAYSEKRDHTYIAYGVSENGVFLRDVWDLDMKTCKWRKINIDESKVIPCAGSRAVIIGKYLWIYGGFHQATYIDNLHVINVDTGEVFHPQTTGDRPLPCSGHSMTYSNGKICIFGGYGHQPCFQLKLLDIQTLEWTSKDTKVNKFSHGFCVSNGITYLSGGSKVNDIIKINHQTEEVEYIKPKGDMPPATITRSSLVGVGNYLVLLGGSCKKKESYTPLRVYDTTTNTWSILQVLPDSYTTSFADGEVDNEGIFRLPSCTDASIVYREKEREIATFQGKPYRDPPVIITFELGKALSVLNHRTDMLSVLNF